MSLSRSFVVLNTKATTQFFTFHCTINYYQEYKKKTENTYSHMIMF